MRSARVVCLLEEQEFRLEPGSVIAQSENTSARVLAFSYVTPFVRIKGATPHAARPGGSPKHSLSKRGVRFRFLTAPGILYPDESSLTGSRWVDTGSSVTFGGQDAIGTTGMAPTIHPPGALLAWVLESLDEKGPVQSLVADIYLVCRAT